MAGGGANKPWSAVLPAALLVLAVILITAKADYDTAASTTGSGSGSGSGLASHCKLPSGCDKALSLSACNNRVYNFLFCPSQRVDEAKNECCKALHADNGREARVRLVRDPQALRQGTVLRP
jgi:hypothetical protein